MFRYLLITITISIIYHPQVIIQNNAFNIWHVQRALGTWNELETINVLIVIFAAMFTKCSLIISACLHLSEQILLKSALNNKAEKVKWSINKETCGDLTLELCVYNLKWDKHQNYGNKILIVF